MRWQLRRAVENRAMHGMPAKDFDIIRQCALSFD
jgi:hypothetical protein